MSYREHLRTVVAASAAPYGYTLTLWTAGTTATHGQGTLPSPWDALLLLVGAVTGFGVVGASACRDVTGAPPSGSRVQVPVWGAMHLPSVGLSILLVTGLAELIEGAVLWPLVGFVATATYLLVLSAQFWVATRGSGPPDPDPSPIRGRSATISAEPRRSTE